VNLILAFRESLAMLLELGMEEVERRYKLISRGLGEAIGVLGLRRFPENPSLSLTAVAPPSNLSADAIRKEMLALGVRVAGGQGRLKGKIFRISHMGADPLDMVIPLSALEIALKRLGWRLKPGEAVGAYLNVSAES